MNESEVTWYVLFPNHTQGLKLNDLLNKSGIRNTIVPTPRMLSKSCGISLIVAEQDVRRVKEIADASSVNVVDIAPMKRDIDPERDRYC